MHLLDSYALNLKGVHYKTQWVELPDVASTRKKLGSEPVRYHRDGSPFYTLPVIHDPSTGSTIGDTFDIAVYLDQTYPDGPPLFPPSTIGLMDAFNKHMDTLFTSFVLLCCHGIPFNPDSFETSKADFLWRAGKTSWDELTVRGEERVKTLEAFKVALEVLVKIYSHRGGPFIDGGKPSYADCIVGGWLAFMKVTMEEWDEVQTWHDGLLGKIHSALEKYAEVK